MKFALDHSRAIALSDKLNKFTSLTSCSHYKNQIFIYDHAQNNKIQALISANPPAILLLPLLAHISPSDILTLSYNSSYLLLPTPSSHFSNLLLLIVILLFYYLFYSSQALIQSQVKVSIIKKSSVHK